MVTKKCVLSFLIVFSIIGGIVTFFVSTYKKEADKLKVENYELKFQNYCLCEDVIFLGKSIFKKKFSVSDLNLIDSLNNLLITFNIHHKDSILFRLELYNLYLDFGNDSLLNGFNFYDGVPLVITKQDSLLLDSIKLSPDAARCAVSNEKSLRKTNKMVESFINKE